jgi:hypothetical protein|tara:strand:+ start:1491 stop:1715 length:225 start_codon:yes stop_codon:yes gene_type:complete
MYEQQPQEGNLISFKVVITQEGNIVSELSHLPLGQAQKIFQKDDYDIIAKIIGDLKEKLDPLHNFIEQGVQSIT